MKNKIKSIKEKEPRVTTLPDGYYNGTWGGHFIEVNYKNKTFELETEASVKSFGINVIVQVENGVATFDIINS